MTPPPVLRLVPGLGLDAAAWGPTMRVLPPSWRRDLEVALLPGYGERAPRRTDLRPAALAEVLLDRWCPPDTAVLLVGHSASCQIVAEAARRLHESVRRSPCPVLVLRGHHDRICPEDWATELAAAAPRPADRAPRAVAVAGAHMIPLTHGHLVARELEGFGVLVAR